jgi:hypothetical protein
MKHGRKTETIRVRSVFNPWPNLLSLILRPFSLSTSHYPLLSSQYTLVLTVVNRCCKMTVRFRDNSLPHNDLSAAACVYAGGARILVQEEGVALSAWQFTT